MIRVSLEQRFQHLDGVGRPSLVSGDQAPGSSGTASWSGLEPQARAQMLATLRQASLCVEDRARARTAAVRRSDVLAAGASMISAAPPRTAASRLSRRPARTDSDSSPGFSAAAFVNAGSASSSRSIFRQTRPKPRRTSGSSGAILRARIQYDSDRSISPRFSAMAAACRRAGSDAGIQRQREIGTSRAPAGDRRSPDTRRQD